MLTFYIRHGRRFSIPSTAQILDELKTDFVPGYVPVGRSAFTPSSGCEAIAAEAETDRRSPPHPPA